MRLFQSERKLSRELSRILTAPKERVKNIERKTLNEEQDFVVYLPSDLEIDEFSSLHHYQIRDGAEVVLSL